MKSENRNYLHPHSLLIMLTLHFYPTVFIKITYYSRKPLSRMINIQMTAGQYSEWA